MAKERDHCPVGALCIADDELLAVGVSVVDDVAGFTGKSFSSESFARAT
jgi:hypothetical protein